MLYRFGQLSWFCIFDGFLGKKAGFPRKKYLYLQTNLLCIVEVLVGGTSMAVAVGVSDK